MKRRAVIRTLAMSFGSLLLPSSMWALDGELNSYPLNRKGSFSLDGNKLRFTHPLISKPFSLTMIADTHLFRDDERGTVYREYSNRMAKAYNQTKHFQSGRDINPEIAFEETLLIAKEQGSQCLALIGDIFSFPSEAAIEWVKEKLNQCGLPYIYTAGNHDWHYEGMEGSSDYLRKTWIDKRLLPFYADRDPMMQKIQINGVNIIVLDNSTYEISEAQLNFFNQSLSDQKPTVLMLHIPMYAPGRSLGFGCGHPQWGAASDKSFQLERRLPWRAEGHTKYTMKFYETIFQSEQVLGVLAGHIHNQSVDVINGIPQVVTESNAEGGYLQISFTA